MLAGTIASDTAGLCDVSSPWLVIAPLSCTFRKSSLIGMGFAFFGKGRPLDEFIRVTDAVAVTACRGSPWSLPGINDLSSSVLTRCLPPGL